MQKIRIIPRLDVKGPNVVKGIHMEGLRVMGSPVELAKKYYEQGADEIVYMDIVASLYGRGIDVALVNAVADELFIPLTVGGGIRSIADINNCLRAGADKVAVNTYATAHPEFLKEAVHEFGAQCIVLSIEAKKNGTGWEVYTDGGREHTGKDVVEWAKEGLDCGVGEILLTSVDNDGTRKGYELDLIRTIGDISDVPLVVYGGAKDSQSLEDAIRIGGADALAMASMLHYDETNIGELKRILAADTFPIRMTA